MGIKGLGKFISERCPNAMAMRPISEFAGCKIAIDVSMLLYQFVIAIRQGHHSLTNEAGETTSHLSGMLSRVTRLLESGIFPVFVFDGEASTLKNDELVRRNERRAEAQELLTEATARGDEAAMRLQVQRTVKITSKHNAEAKRLLESLGMPCIDAPSEAEAQCAFMCRSGLVDACATEDSDCLPHGTPVVLRRLNYSSGKNDPTVLAIELEAVLRGLDLTMSEFIDFCILCGCDYCGTIRNIGNVRAYEFVKQHKTIENILERLDPKLYTAPENFNYQEARVLFTDPPVISLTELDLKWKAVQVDNVIDFLVNEQQFSRDRVMGYIERIKRAGNRRVQPRLDAFLPRVKAPLRAVLPVNVATKKNALKYRRKQK